jgi:uncharacterized membrane protein YebE (DUF533 family)
MAGAVGDEGTATGLDLSDALLARARERAEAALSEAEFINAELANPADIGTLAEGLAGQEEAAQIYAAARLAIDPDTQEEQDFLAALAQALAIEPGLVAHIDAAASSAKG